MESIKLTLGTFKFDKSTYSNESELLNIYCILVTEDASKLDKLIDFIEFNPSNILDRLFNEEA